MADYRLSGRRDAANLADIDPELMGPVTVWDRKESDNSPLEDTRGAVDMSQPVEMEASARWASPSVVPPAPPEA